MGAFMNHALLHPKSPSVILVGHSGSGKTTIANALNKATGIEPLELGFVVRKSAAQSMTDPLSHADAVISKGKYLTFVEAALSGHVARPALIVGPRQPQEVKFLRDVLGPSLVVALEAPAFIRSVRRGNIANLECPNIAWLSHRDLVERDWGIETIIAEADLRVDSTGTVENIAQMILRAWKQPADRRGKLPISSYRYFRTNFFSSIDFSGKLSVV
jgi:energy-coupling factor transporter ATP-binding protein EcfA2